MTNHTIKAQVAGSEQWTCYTYAPTIAEILRYAYADPETQRPLSKNRVRAYAADVKRRSDDRDPLLGLVFNIPEAKVTSDRSATQSMGTPVVRIAFPDQDAAWRTIDGQHRLEMMRMTVDRGDLPADERIPCHFFVNLSKTQERRVFVALNRGIRPSRSTTDYFQEGDPVRDSMVRLIERLPVFRNCVDMHGKNPGAGYAFTFSALMDAHRLLVKRVMKKPGFSEAAAIQAAERFWTAVDDVIGVHLKRADLLIGKRSGLRLLAIAGAYIVKTMPAPYREPVEVLWNALNWTREGKFECLVKEGGRVLHSQGKEVREAEKLMAFWLMTTFPCQTAPAAFSQEMIRRGA